MRKAAAYLLLCLCLAACGKDNNANNFIPYVPVNKTVQVTSDQQLNARGGYAYVEGGVAGIVVYHRLDDSYVAYDRCSSYQPEKKCAVEIDKDAGFQVIDPCSGSKFKLDDGTPVKAPASRSLRSYTVIKRNIYEIQITN